jgi:hypothetical protein
MTLQEFMDSDEYHSIKRMVYFSNKTPKNIKDLGSYAHQKAMSYFKLKYKQQ